MVRPKGFLSFVALHVFYISILSSCLVHATSDHVEYDSVDHTLIEKRAGNYGSGLPWWHAQIDRKGKPAYGTNSSYIIYRNVRDYGAKGDGITDDTDAINNATFDGRICIYPCDSATTNPAIVYFPPGRYMVSRPLIMTYYTQFVGDANDLPILQALPSFNGIGILDSDPYLAYGFSWYQNQNNFYRHVRNFVLDLTLLPASGDNHALHWQVAQATSLQNVVFNMVEGGDDNAQIGIFMDNGSGGWMEDLIFNGGHIGFFSGNQQFTSRNLTFNNCQIGIYQNWNWLFHYKETYFYNCGTAIDITQGGSVITTGSILLTDSIVSGCDNGILTYFQANSTPTAGGTVVMDNVDFIDTPNAVAFPNGTVIVAGNQKVDSFLQGRVYTAYDAQTQVGNLTCYQPTAQSARIQQTVGKPPKSASLLDGNGNIFTTRRPQYEGEPLSSFVSILDFGCPNDGVTDATDCVQRYFNSLAGTDNIGFIDHGAYVIRDTIQVPNNIKLIGEIWPEFMVDGSSSVFSDYTNPKPAFRVGNPGDTGVVEMTEIVFQTRGPAPGAIMMEWNLAGTYPGAAAMWDVHWRIGGTNGSLLQSSNCVKTPTKPTVADFNCAGAFLLIHITDTAKNLYMSNNWGWVSDHELDLPDHNQINIWNGRGMLIESQGPVWVLGSSVEHSMLYNYQVANAKDVYLGIIQSETAYMQNNPNALLPFPPSDEWDDPTFDSCYIATCPKTMALRVYNSTYVFNYGAGLYSFFNNYDGGCLLTSNCQENIVSVEMSEGVYLYALSTKASTNMVEVDGAALVPQAANINGFCDTVAVFEYP